MAHQGVDFSSELDLLNSLCLLLWRNIYGKSVSWFQPVPGVDDFWWLAAARSGCSGLQEAVLPGAFTPFREAAGCWMFINLHLILRHFSVFFWASQLLRTITEYFCVEQHSRLPRQCQHAGVFQQLPVHPRRHSEVCCDPFGLCHSLFVAVFSLTPCATPPTTLLSFAESFSVSPYPFWGQKRTNGSKRLHSVNTQSDVFSLISNLTFYAYSFPSYLEPCLMFDKHFL